ncbi:ATP-binding protein [Terasakiella pusilla]|uniref:ATP-binding protein n=1 Tax=Terasakiella pusilla TaxID=64973 RepID=UPI003AA9DA88
MSENKINPADGERRAVRGLNAQYRIAAKLIYQALLSGNMEWIRVADPNAGRVDDIQIATRGRLDAYQVKWNDFPDTFTFNNLTSASSDGNPSLIEQLADGWKRLNEIHPSRYIHVHLSTGDTPSSSNSGVMPFGEKEPSPKHFGAFLRFAWKAFRERKAVPTEWESVLNGLRKATSLTKNEFHEFAPFAHLDFSIPDPRDESIRNASDNRRRSDIETIAAFLSREIGGAERRIEYKLDDLLNGLGWEDRFKTINKHEFRVDEYCYRPIAGAVQALENSLNIYDKGYLALIGTPGSGKSTTLTQHFRYKEKVRVIKYYAFTPDGQNTGRGESTNFLHDLYVEINNHGFRGDIKSFPKSREDYQTAFLQQLAQLNTDWQESGTRTLLLIDGLDHIEREQSPQRTLLKDLPEPTDIPDGILVILGSQKLELDGMPPSINRQLSGEDQRIINMFPLERDAVHEIIEAYDLPVSLNVEQKDQVLSLSSGHPLALSYLLNKLFQLTENQGVEQTLSAENPYEGHIENDYEQYWKAVEKVDDLIEVFGLISRMRIDIDLKALMAWTSQREVKRLMDDFGHFFIRKSKTNWSFFHNSFRQFLLQKTGYDIFEDVDEEKHKEYHQKLAEFAAKSDQSQPWSWEQLYHLSASGNDESVLAVAEQDYFRQQFLNLRPIGKIVQDLTFAFQAAKNTHDGVAIARFLLIEKEIRDRDTSLSETKFEELLFDLRGEAALKAYIIDGVELLISHGRGIEVAKHMIAYGHVAEAREIFNLSEPLEYLTGSTKFKQPRDQDQNILNGWAEIAHYYKPVDEIYDHLRCVKVKLEHWQDEVDPEKIAKNYQDTALLYLAYGLLHRGETALFDQLINRFEKDGESHLVGQAKKDQYYFHTNSEAAVELFDERFKEIDREKASDGQKLFIASGLIKHYQDYETAKEWLAGIEQPNLAKKTNELGTPSFSAFTNRIRLCSALASVNTSVSPTVVIPVPEKKWDHGAMYFERMIVLIANVHGNSRSKIEHRNFSINLLKPAISLFNKSHQDTHDWHNWYHYQGLSKKYFSFLIDAVHAHGKQAITLLKGEFERQWTSENTKRFWDTGRKRHIAVKLYDIQGDRDWLVRQLELIEEDFNPYEDLYTQIEDYYEHANAWLDIGEKERAESILLRIFECSFGIEYHKDNQIVDWVRWLSIAHDKDVPNLPNITKHFAGALAVLQNSYRGTGAEDAVQGYLSIIAQYYPHLSFPISEWLLGEYAANYTTEAIGMASGILKGNPESLATVLQITKHQVIPFELHADQDFAKQIFEGITELDDPQAKEKLIDLIECLKTRAYPACRETWFKALRDVIALQRERFTWATEYIGEAPPRKNGVEGELIHVNGGVKLNRLQVQEQVYDFASFKEFYAKIEKNDGFPWERVLPVFIDTLGLSETLQVYETLLAHEPRLKTYALFVKRLIDLDATEQAKKITEIALSQSSVNGWVRMFDGGTRRTAFQCLKEVGVPDIQNQAIEQFVNDFLSEARPTRYLVSELDELLSFFFEELPYEKIWSEIRNHVENLFDFKISTEEPPFDFSVRKPDVAYSGIVNFLFYSLTIPVRNVMTEAFQAICNLMDEGKSEREILNKIVEFVLSGDPLKQQIALSIISESYLPDHSELRQTISSLTTSNHLEVRLSAISLAKEYGLSHLAIDKSRKELPPAYSLILPEISQADSRIAPLIVKPGTPLPDLDDPIELVGAFNLALDDLADFTGIEIQNLVSVFVRHMKSAKPFDEWNSKAEKDLASFLEGRELKLTYRRPRADVQNIAYNMVLADLYDAERIDENFLEYNNHFTALIDPVTARKTPITQPCEIVPPHENEEAWRKNSEWIEEGGETLKLLKDQLDDGRYIIAERSKFIDYDRAYSTEKRMTAITPHNFDYEEIWGDVKELYPSKEKWCASKYPEMMMDYNLPILCMRGDTAQVQIGESQWLAFNPIFGLKFGWKLDHDGLFRWVNSDGKIMVESIWWQSGPTNGYSFMPRSFNGGGWLVVATEEALEVIRQATGPSKKTKLSVRSYKDEQTRQECFRSFVNVENW